MKEKVSEIKKIYPLQLSGTYGDIFSNLRLPVVYSPNNDLYATIYVANVTDDTREYMLQASLYRGDDRIDQFTITIDGLSWFTVESESVIQIPTTLNLSVSDVVLIIDLYERESSSVTDSLDVALTSKGTEGLPEYPQLPTLPPVSESPSTGFEVGSIITPMISLIMVIMMMKMMTKSMKKVEEDK